MKDNQNKRRKLTDEQVEQMLARAVQKNVPDILQQAASTPVTPLAMVDEILPVQYPRRRPHWQRLAAACLMLLLTGAGIFSWLWFPTRAVVSIEVNPSVALSLNRFSYVINTRANNDDGAELLDDLSLNNLKLDTALNALIGAMDRQGYLTPSAQVNIFVDGKDDDYNRQLYQQVTDSFSHLLPSQAPQEETKEQEDTRRCSRRNRFQTDLPVPLPVSRRTDFLPVYFLAAGGAAGLPAFVYRCGQLLHLPHRPIQRAGPLL